MKNTAGVEAGQLRPKDGWATAVDPDEPGWCSPWHQKKQWRWRDRYLLPGRQSANGRAHLSKGWNHGNSNEPQEEKSLGEEQEGRFRAKEWSCWGT
eukprot:CAMPEP_0197459148 /NCGR_PEP_ID=MMETSP1175-20131217/50582_1 /TAXON_ID=1003142 /ORGANISM="Triceratium dubium, Strain CCMP147" /LENGTH=95 /DNA_ID=CAMNT_0042993937 /DNA_START=259 /DNA_END=543 /DNA_ORIENTATION=+